MVYVYVMQLDDMRNVLKNNSHDLLDIHALVFFKASLNTKV